MILQGYLYFYELEKFLTLTKIYSSMIFEID